LLQNDELWYIRQLEPEDDNVKQRLLTEIQSQVEEEGQADHVKVFQQIFTEREADAERYFEPTTLETYDELYQRMLRL